MESIRRTPAFDQKALHTAIITHLYRKGAFRSAAKLAEVRRPAVLDWAFLGVGRGGEGLREEAEVV